MMNNFKWLSLPSFNCKSLDDYQFSSQSPFADLSLIDVKTYFETELFITGRLKLILKSQDSILLFEFLLSAKPLEQIEPIEAFVDLLETLFNFIRKEIKEQKLQEYSDFIVPDFPYSKEFFILDNNDHFRIIKRSLLHENKKSI